MNRSMPPGVVIPELAYPDVRAAVGWLCRAFGFVERLRIGNHRAQLSFGEGSVIVTGQRVDPGASASEAPDARPLSAGGFNHSVMVRVVDVDNHYEHAKQFDARIVNPPTDYPYGERQYTAYFSLWESLRVLRVSLCNFYFSKELDTNEFNRI